MKFLEVYGDQVWGAIRGLDRVRFRGTARLLSNESGAAAFLKHAGVLLKDFGKWAQSKTTRLRTVCEERAEELGIKMTYLQRPSINKEALAREIAARDGVREDGSICMFSVVEPCLSVWVEGNRSTGKLHLRMRERKCVWIYHYWDHPEIGFGHVRVQTWMPYTVQICINGRHWLERQLQEARIGYVKDGNCFPWIADVGAAQRLMDEQLKTDWPMLLNQLAHSACPELSSACSPIEIRHYWSADETEWATDVMFRSKSVLDRLYPRLIDYGMRVSDSPAILRYLGQRDRNATGRERMPREILSDVRKRYEGVRIKHYVNRNSVKMYNKSGSILRVETTINNTLDFKVFRHPDDDEQRPKGWHKMRKGVSDLHRRCQVSDECTKRYLDTISAAHVAKTLQEIVRPACNRVRKDGQTYRALNPWNHEDFKLLTFLAKGEHTLNGFRNRDLRRWLYPADTEDNDLARSQSAKVTRLIRLLRAHGLIRKQPKVTRYILTPKGRHFACALMTASALEAQKLTDLAA